MLTRAHVETVASALKSDEIFKDIKEKQQYESAKALLETIRNDKENTNNMIFILNSAYDKIHKKYNAISLAVLILSSVATLIEALRLSILDFVGNYEYVDLNTISFTMNIFILFIGTIITVSSSIIRFRNYREILEQLKDVLALLISFKEKYDKKYLKVLNLLALDEITPEEITKISEKLSEYDNAIKTIDINQFIRNDEIIKFNEDKAAYDFKMRKIDIDSRLAINNYETAKNIKDITESNLIPKKLKDELERISMNKLKNIIASLNKPSTSSANTNVNEIVVDGLQQNI